MKTFSSQPFNCQFYVSPRGNMSLSLPREDGPRRAITLQAIEYDDLVDTSFRRLLAAFNSVPQPLQIVQV